MHNVFGFRNVDFDLTICSILEGAFGKCVKIVDARNIYPTKQPKYYRNNCRIKANQRQDNRRAI
jgi:hypothetical protein